MSYRDVGDRRLDLPAALRETARALPRLWLGGFGALLLCAGAGLAPLWVDLDGTRHWLWIAGAVITGLVAVGALARLSIKPTLAGARGLGLGPAGLQLGWPEARLLGAALLCLIFLAMIVVVLAIVVLAIFGASELDVAAIQARDWAAVGPPWKLGLLSILALVSVLIPILLLVRLSLFAPATVGRRQMVSLNSMGIAYGSFWSLLAGLVLTSAPVLLLFTLIATDVLTGGTASIAGIIGLAGLQLPLSLGFLGAVYQQLEYWSPEERHP